jgi:hypothetical protein
MMKIVCLRRGQEGQVIAAVGDSGGEIGKTVPHPHGGHMRGHQQGANDYRQHVADEMLEGVSVDGRQADGRHPLVVHLVDARVQVSTVQQPVTHLQHAQKLLTSLSSM